MENEKRDLELQRFEEAIQKDYDQNPAFPTFLSVSIEIKRALEKEDFSLDAVLRTIQREPLITAKIIGTANSAFYTVGKPIVDLKAAAMRLGTNLVRAIAYSTSAQQIARADSLRPIMSEILQLWSHTIETSCWAYTLSLHYGVGSPDEALLCGFFQDLGKLCLLVKAAERPKVLANKAAFIALVKKWHMYVETNIMQALNMGHLVVNSVPIVIPPQDIKQVVSVASLLAEGKDPFFEPTDTDGLPLEELWALRSEVETLQKIF
jgi:HD-like signal output (HDOD) protein